jgi:hypothetical protein
MEKGFSWSNIAVGEYQLVSVTSRQRDVVADQSGFSAFFAFMVYRCHDEHGVFGCGMRCLAGHADLHSALLMIVIKSVVLLFCSS